MPAIKTFDALKTALDPFRIFFNYSFTIWRRSVGMYTLYDTRSRKWTKFFLVKHWGPKPPGNPSELIFALFGGLWGPFFKKT